jgi:hypothetical protein
VSQTVPESSYSPSRPGIRLLADRAAERLRLDEAVKAGGQLLRQPERQLALIGLSVTLYKIRRRAWKFSHLQMATPARLCAGRLEHFHHRYVNKVLT